MGAVLSGAGKGAATGAMFGPWGAVAGGLIGGIGSYLSNKSKQNQAQDQSKLYNDWLKQYQANQQGMFQGAQAAGWNPYGPSTSTSQQSGSSSTSGSFNNRPVITEQYAPLDEMMRGIMSSRLSGGSSLPNGYAQNAIRGINESYEGADQAARNMAARRGLSGEQTYAIASPANRARAGAIADLRGSLPLLERQMQNEDIGITQGLQSAFGRGEQGRSSSNTSSSSMGSSTKPFDTGDLAQLMAMMAPPGPQQTMQTGYSPVGNAMQSGGSLLATLIASGALNKNQGWGGGGVNYGNLRGEGGAF